MIKLLIKHLKALQSFASAGEMGPRCRLIDDGTESFVWQLTFVEETFYRKAQLKGTISDPKFQTLLFFEPPDFFAYSGRNSLK